jgi:hypothetical protein
MSEITALKEWTLYYLFDGVTMTGRLEGHVNGTPISDESFVITLKTVRSRRNPHIPTRRELFDKANDFVGVYNVGGWVRVEQHFSNGCHRETWKFVLDDATRCTAAHEKWEGLV